MEVICSRLAGTFLLGPIRIRCHCHECIHTGQTFTPKGFESHAGREAAKKCDPASL